MAKQARQQTVRRHRLIWRDWTLTVRHTTNYLGFKEDHIEITVAKPKGAPIPITDTGYRSHFMQAADLKRAGGPVAFVTAWLEQEARTKAWARAELKWRQLELELLPPAAKPKRREQQPTPKGRRAPA